MPSGWVEMGRIGRPYGLQGWVHLESWADPPESLLRHGVWYLTGGGRERVAVKVLASRSGPAGLVARVDGSSERDDAAALVGAVIELRREDLPAPAPGQYFRDDLLGFRVRNLEGVEFGTLERFVDMPASPVMVVKGETERWLPVTRQHLQRIDPEERCLWVDWPADF